MELCTNFPKSYHLIIQYVNRCINESSRFAYYEIINDEIIKGQNLGKFSLGFLLPLVFFYTVMIIIGWLGSSLVIFVVLRSKTLRTPRNMFILNLAITDMVLCAFTQPFNIIRLLSFHKEWIFGPSVCKLVSLFTGTNVCVSTISITAIALDRYQVILVPSRSPLKLHGAIKAMVAIWIISFILASPLLAFSKIESIETPFTNFTRCTEHTEEHYMRKLKVAYSILTLFLLYIIPLTIVIITYTKIYQRIKQRMKHSAIANHYRIHEIEHEHLTLQSKNELLTQKQKSDIRRQRRANLLLLSITVVFATSWLPLNLSNLIMDLHLLLKQNLVTSSSIDDPNLFLGQFALIIQSICLLMVLSSACTNPILYGWLNDSFRQEFKRVFFVLEPRTRETINETTRYENQMSLN